MYNIDTDGTLARGIYIMKPFDLEQLIMECWQVTSDIKVVYEEHIDFGPMSEDEIANILIGMEQLYSKKFERLFREYEAVCKHGGIFLDEDDVQTGRDKDDFDVDGVKG